MSDEGTGLFATAVEANQRNGPMERLEEKLAASEARVRALEEALLDGNRALPMDRETLGRLVREAWVRWAQTQPNPKPSWLLPYDELSEPDKEADRQIGETIARWTLIYDAARTALGASNG